MCAVEYVTYKDRKITTNMKYVEISLFCKTVQKAIKSESFGYQSFSCTYCIFMPCYFVFEANPDF